MNNSYNLFKRILGDGRSYIPTFLTLGGIAFVMVPVEFFGLLLSRKLIDNGFMLRDWDTIKDILLVLIILFMLRGLISYGTAIFSTRFQLRINQKFQNELFSHILHLPMRFFTREPTGQLMSRVLDDATRFSSIFNLLFGPALLNPLKFIALLVFLTYINARLCLLMVISTIFSFMVIHWVGKKMRIISKEIQKKNASIYSLVEQIFPNIELVKSKITEKETAQGFRRLMGELIQLSLRMLKITLISSPILQLLKYLALGGVFVYGSWMISKDLLTVGTLTIFLGATYLFFNTLNSLGNSYGSLRENLARMEIIYGIMDRPPERVLKRPDYGMPSSINSIEFKNISFSYNPSTPVLKDVSFDVSRGETLGITGQSGSGKTTLARLLLRFYEPDSGEIRLNRQLLHQIDLDSLRSSIGIAFQENPMLNVTIKENIDYGHDRIPMERVIRAAKISHSHAFIKTLPDQYDTIVGEGGKSLSGGERQRLAIARAIIDDPEILILDEGTSFLEVEQEEAILNKIKETRRGKITVIISHRLSAISLTDRILTLDNGRVLETEFQFLADLSKGKLFL